MKVKEITYKSESGLCDIWARRCQTVDNPKAVVQLIHGMCEHSLRYDEFIEKLCNAGYVVYMADNLGHGKSVASKSDFGFFKDDNGYKYLVDDTYELTKIAKKENPDLPFVIFGHSMGSFICRQYCVEYGDEIDGAVFCGTSGKITGTGVGLALAKIIKSIKGDHYRSKMLLVMAFDSYNKRTEKLTYSDWLCRDRSVVESYCNDELCGVPFTTNGYVALFNLVKMINSDRWYASVPANLPILLMAGEEDPVGYYGKGVKQVFDKLVRTGHNQVSLNLYKDDRHEILNELDKEQVIEDTIGWITSIVNSSYTGE